MLHKSPPVAMFVPSANGVVIPKSPHELMKMIQAQKKKDNTKVVPGKKSNGEIIQLSVKCCFIIMFILYSLAGSAPTVDKQEQQSENLETKLMELEDYTTKPEGVHRLLRIYEIITM